MTRDTFAEHTARLVSEDRPGTHTRLGLDLWKSRRYERPGFYVGRGRRVLRAGRAAVFYDVRPGEPGEIFRPQRAVEPRRQA